MRVCSRTAWWAATCEISCAITPAISASSSAVRIKPLLTNMKPPGRAMALTSSESMTLMVKGTLASEFFTRFCAIRLTYSTTTGSSTNLTLFCSCMEYCLPIPISVSVEYQLPMPRPPISRLPTAFTSSMLPGFTPGMVASGEAGADPDGGAEAGVAVGAGAAGVDPEGVGDGAWDDEAAGASDAAGAGWLV